MQNSTNVVYNQQQKCVILKLEGFVKGDDYRNAMLQTLEVGMKNFTGKFILDWTKKGITAPEDLTWFLTQYVPDLHKRMSKKMYVAVLKSENIFGNATAQKAIEDVRKNFDINIRIFATEHEAFEWFESN